MTTEGHKKWDIYNKGIFFGNQGKIEKALTFFKQAIEIDPDFLEAWARLGHLYHVLREEAKKVECLLKAVELCNKLVEKNPSESSIFIM